MKIIKNVDLYDFNRLQKESYLVFDKTIKDVGKMSDFSSIQGKYNSDKDDIFDAGGRMLVPGLAIMHTHIYSTFARGMILPFNAKDFKQVLEQLWWKMDAALDNDMNYYSALVSAMGYLKQGVTSVIDHHASGKDIIGSLTVLKKGVVDQVGLRGMFCFETSDRFDINRCLQENLDFYQTGKTGEWGGHFGMHASMTLSDKTLEKIKSVIGDIPIHIHAAESILDQEDSQTKYGISVIERLDRFGLLNPDSLIVHGIYLNDRELELIKERGAWLVMNPSSNMNNGVGLADYARFKEAGVRCLIGNDGMSQSIANEWQALLFGMHHKYTDPCAFGMDDLLKIINNGYDYFNEVLGTRIGRLEQGYMSDFILLDESAPTPLTEINAMGHLFYGQAMSWRPSYVWSHGEMKLDNYQLKLPFNDIHVKSREQAEKLWRELGVPV